MLSTMCYAVVENTNRSFKWERFEFHLSRSFSVVYLSSFIGSAINMTYELWNAQSFGGSPCLLRKYEPKIHNSPENMWVDVQRDDVSSTLIIYKQI